MSEKWSIISALLLIGLAAGAPLPPEAPLSPEDWDNVVAAAKREGQVVIYTALSPYEMDALSNSFSKRFPEIKVRYLRSNSGEAQARLDQERAQQVNGADIGIITEPVWYIDRAKAHELLPIDGPSAVPWRPLERYFFGDYAVLHIMPWVIAWNTNLVRTPIAGYKDLLRPDLKGKIGTLGLVTTSIDAFYDWLDKNLGADYWPALAAQQPRMYVSTTPLGQALGSGEVGVGMFEISTAFQALVQKGAPIQSAFPAEVTFGNAEFVAAVAWSKRPNAARVFVDYAMSADGQNVLHKGGNGVSPLGKAMVPESQDIPNLKVIDLAPYTPAAIDQLTDRWNAIFLN